MKKDKIVKLAANCFFVKGFRKNLLIDLQNNNWYHVQFELDSSNEVDITNLQKENLDYLLDRQILIKIPAELKANFPNITTDFDVPSMIEFAILDRHSTSSYSLERTLNWFDSLLVKFCQIRFYQQPSILEVEEILTLTYDSNIESLDLLLPFSNEFADFFDQKTELFPKLNSIVFHSSDKHANQLNDPTKRRLYITEAVSSADSCGIVHPALFSNAKKHILKSINYNSCLYKKIGVDVNGNIRNCPSAPQIIGHVDQLDQLSTKKLETPLWYIKKDDVAVCKDCEFRYICTDCRIRTVDGEYSRPETCPYNPYTNTWRGQEGYEEPEKYQK